MKHTQPPRGSTLIEALIGVVILCLSLSGAMRLQSWMRLNAEIARDRSVAAQLAQQELEQSRHALATAGFEPLAGGLRAEPGTTTRYALERTVSSPLPQLKTEQVDLRWHDRGGTQHTVGLVSNLSGLSPVYAAALSLPPQDQVLAVRRQLPASAASLGDGRSAVRPFSRSPIAWIVQDSTGEITAQCALPPDMPARRLVAADLATCTPWTGSLLRGYIRFSTSTTPDPLQANDAPLALSLSVPQGHCETEAVASGAERYVAYACALPAGSSRVAAVRIVPLGWAFGDTAATYRACRHEGTPGTVGPQNFLVIRGDVPCPGALASQNPQTQIAQPHNGDSAVATVQHQP